jgi:hypothetical protein
MRDHTSNKGNTKENTILLAMLGIVQSQKQPGGIAAAPHPQSAISLINTVTTRASIPTRRGNEEDIPKTALTVFS